MWFISTTQSNQLPLSCIYGISGYAFQAKRNFNYDLEWKSVPNSKHRITIKASLDSGQWNQFSKLLPHSYLLVIALIRFQADLPNNRSFLCQSVLKYFHFFLDFLAFLHLKTERKKNLLFIHLSYSVLELFCFLTLKTNLAFPIFLFSACLHILQLVSMLFLPAWKVQGEVKFATPATCSFLS